MQIGQLRTTISCGIVFGLCAIGLMHVIRKARRAISCKMSSRGVTEMLERLESEGKIQLYLSPADNAVSLLENAVSDVQIKASIVYALNVLKSDLSHASVPVGLEGKGSSRRCSVMSNESEVVVLDWLISSYTRKPSILGRTNKSASQKIKLGLNFRGAHISPSYGGSYIYEVSPDELDRLHEALDGVDDWDWDVWKLYHVSKARPLQTLGWHLLHKWGVVSALNLDVLTIKNWLKFVESMYQDTEYHSATHAADVLQAVNYLLGKVGAAAYLSTLRIFALLIAAIIHDVGHDGKNNTFHENAMTERALMFNDQNIQENFHCMTIFSSMSKNSNLNILGQLPRDQAKEVRRLVILMTLGTDMKLHFKHCQKYRSLISILGRNKTQWIAHPDASDALCVNLLHAADLSNPCRKFEFARKWATRVLNEFFAQGDVEMRMGLPVSPMCSRGTTLLPASQIGFISFIVLPYFQFLRETFPRLDALIDRLESNLHCWRTLDSEEADCACLPTAAAGSSCSSGAGQHCPADAQTPSTSA